MAEALLRSPEISEGNIYNRGLPVDVDRPLGFFMFCEWHCGLFNDIASEYNGLANIVLRNDASKDPLGQYEMNPADSVGPVLNYKVEQNPCGELLSVVSPR
jgi:hypothetical protein